MCSFVSYLCSCVLICVVSGIKSLAPLVCFSKLTVILYVPVFWCYISVAVCVAGCCESDLNVPCASDCSLMFVFLLYCANDVLCSSYVLH